MCLPEPVNDALRFLRLCCVKGWRPAWRAGVFGLGVTVVGVVVFVASASPLLIIVALSVGVSAVLLPGGYVAYAEQLEAARASADKAARTEHLERLVELQKQLIEQKSKELFVSQEQYKVLHGFEPVRPHR